MNLKKIEFNFYRWSSKYYFVFSYGLILLLIYFIFPFHKKWISYSFQNHQILFISITLFISMIFLIWLTTWGWYHIFFRFVSYGLSWIIFYLQRILSKWWLKLFLLLLMIHTLLYIRYHILYGDFNLKNFFHLKYMEKTFILLILSLIFHLIIKARKRLHISEFQNFTGKFDKDIVAAINGISALISNEMGWISKVLKDVDEMQPEKKNNKIQKDFINVQEFSKSLDELSGALSAVTVGTVLKIPVGPLLNFISRLMHGPQIRGSIHSNGKILFIKASIKGGKFYREWSTSSNELDSLVHLSDTEKIMKLTEILAYKIVAYISESGSPRWEAVKHYTKGLTCYRESILEISKYKQSLIRAKRHFGLSLRYDSTFHQCYYNLGIVYRELGNDKSAEEAFRIVLSLEPSNHHCYYQLAQIYYYQKDYCHAQWCCEQALNICPSLGKYWNLLALIKYDIFKNEKTKENGVGILYTGTINIPSDIVNDFMNTSMLSWKELCRQVIKDGNKIKEQKEKSVIHLRNQAKVSGMREKRMVRLLFSQALFLNSNDNDLFMELGKYYFRKKNYLKASKAFVRIFEDDNNIYDSFSFWTLYFVTIANLINIKKYSDDIICKRDLNQCSLHFKEGIAWLIDNIYNGRIIADEITFKKNINLMKATINDPDIYSRIKNCNLSTINLRNQFDELNLILDWIEDGAPLSSSQIIENIKQKFLELKEEEYPSFQWIILHKKILNIIKNSNPDSIEYSESIQKAIDLLNILNDNEIKLTGIYRHIAEAYFKINNFSDALVYTRNSIKIDPYFPETRHLLGKIYFQMNDYKNALKEFITCYNFDEIQRINLITDIYKTYLKMGDSKKKWAIKKKIYKNGIRFLLETLEILNDKSTEVYNSQFIQNLKNTHLYLADLYERLTIIDKMNYHLKISNALNGTTSP